MAPPAKDPKTVWAGLLQIAALLTGAILVFVWSPPRLTPEDDGATYVHATRFVAAIIAALVLIVVRRRQWRARTMVLWTAGAAVFALAALFLYRILIGLWTCGYDGRGPVVIGSTMLPDAQRYAAANAVRNCHTMIQDAAGDTASIWSFQELLMRHVGLSAIFVAIVLLFTITGLLAAEAYRLHGSAAAREPDSHP